MGVNGKYVEIALIGLYSIKNYRVYSCIGAGGKTSFNLYLPLGEDKRIDAALAAQGGEAAEHGLFGRRGNVIFLGRIPRKTAFEAISFHDDLTRHSIVVEYWAPTQRVTKPTEFLGEVKAQVSAAAEVVKYLRGIGVGDPSAR